MAHPSKVTARRTDAGIAIDLDARLADELKPGTALEAVSHGADALVVLRQGQSLQGYFAGTLGAFTLPEIFGLIVSGVRTGKLVVDFGSIRKTISFRDGQIIFATSSQPYERLGHALVRLALITDLDLQDALRDVGPGVRLGQVLVRNKRLTAQALYSAMTFLVREIVVDLFEMVEGQFIFLEGVKVVDDALKLPERTRELVLEGIKRGEEVARLRKRLSPTLLVRRGEAAEAGEHAALAERLTGPMALGQLRGQFEGGDYAFLSAIDDLLRRGALVEHPLQTQPSPAPMTERRSTLELYGELIQAICQSLLGAGKSLGPLREFLSEPFPRLEHAFKDVVLSDDGRLNVEQVMANVGAAKSGRARAQAYEVLSAFVSYAMFSAQNVLPKAQADNLQAELRRIEATGE